MNYWHFYSAEHMYLLEQKKLCIKLLKWIIVSLIGKISGHRNLGSISFYNKN